MNPKITKKISYFAPIGLALYWLILLKESAMPESKEGFILQSGYIKYLLGWISIFLLSVGLAYVHYKWVFLKIVYHYSPAIRYLWSSWVSVLVWLIFEFLQFRTGHFGGYIDENILISLLILILILLVAYIGDYIRTKQLQTKLLQSKSEADLHALKAQINPHFLFNVLNTVYNQASLEESPNTADMILKISDLLRFSIEEAPKNKIPLEKEISFLQNYIDLQKARLPQNPMIELDFHWEIPANTCVISPMLLMPLAENAFRYGLSLSHPCYIRLSAILEQQTLKFSIENSNFAVGREGLGTGLKQVQERLKLEYNNQNVFHIQKNDKTFSVQLKLNLGN
ncbi:hypothetical protein GOQ04_15125 [Emticicia sp. ODNR4P]|jgi:sensor histidine kinase YesM|nr:hypothetical protein [Emticicia sp. ODNR4P]